MTTNVYAAGRTKRARATKVEVEARREALVQIVRESAPTGVRFVYYRAASKGIVGKKQSEYEKVQRDLMVLRESGAIQWSQIVDSTRWVRRPETWRSPAEALRETAAFYRRSLWDSSESVVEVWCESESVAGVIYPTTESWAVPLYPMKGQSSASFAWGAAQQYKRDRRPLHVLYVGDHDPAGLQIERNLQEKLTRFSERDDIEVVRVACLPEQISDLGLLGTPAKSTTWYDCITGENHPFVGDAVEVEAIDAPVLRRILTEKISAHVDPWELERLERVEDAERQSLLAFADKWSTWGGDR